MTKYVGSSIRFATVIALVILVSPSFVPMTRAFTNHQRAVLVIGQTSFTTSNCTTTISGLCGPYGVAFDKSGNLWVADSFNNRVLEFKLPFADGESASIVIGQSTFTSKACTTTQSGLCTPFGVAVDSSGNLWVADTYNNRILEFRPPFSNGESASLILGQPSYTSNSCTSPTARSLCAPVDLVFGPKGGLWVADASDNRVLQFKAPVTSGESASTVLGQPSFTSTNGCNSTSKPNCFSFPGGVAFDSKGNIWVADADNGRAMKFVRPFTNGESASLILPCGCWARGIAVDSSGDLWVSDGDLSRVVGFKPPITSGENPSLVIGQPNLTSHNCATTRSGLCNVRGITVDRSGNLWVADPGNSRVLKYLGS